MSELRSAVEAYRFETLAGQTDARIEEGFAELQRVVEMAEVERLRRLAEIDRRGLYAGPGHLSTASWLADKHRVAWGVAKGDVHAARALEEMPVTRRALDEGDLSMSGARVLIRARDADPEAFRDVEGVLVEAAMVHSSGDLRRIATYWQQQVQRGAAIQGEEKLREQRALYVSTTLEGMVRIDGWLDPEAGEIALTAIGAVVDAEVRSGEDDDRTRAQRRADALAEVCRRFLDRSDRPEVAGERPHVTVTLDAAALRDEEAVAERAERTGALGDEPGDTVAIGFQTCELDHTGPVAPGTARRIACDASIRRVVLAVAPSPWTLDARRRSCRRGCAGRWSCVTAGAASPDAIVRTRGATPITSCTGPTAARRRSPTSC